jgi:cell division protein FtsI/penicillin-binding protein 2
MKSAYELAMERLNKTAPLAKLTDEQKKELAELDSHYAAKLAEREIFLKGEIEKAAGKGEWETMEQLQDQLVRERKSVRAELEEKKEAVRRKSAGP